MSPTTPRQRIAITGATGMVGQALIPFLISQGHTVVPISRRPLRGGVQWDPDGRRLDPAPLEGLDAVIHLAGESLAGGRWTTDRKRVLRESRVGPTTLLAETLAALRDRPRVLLSASAIGIYGDRGSDVLDEHSTVGTDFLARLAVEWEDAAAPASAAGIRVVHPRFGMILSPTGGALAKMLPAFRLGVGGPMGGGAQWVSWVALDDVLAALRHTMLTETLTGPVNVVAPDLVTNRVFAETLGRALHRPALMPIPAFALRLLFGEMADATILASQRVVSRRLKESGFQFGEPVLRGALRGWFP